MLALKEHLLRLGPVARYLSNSRTAPSFFIIGFQKCGTTSLFNHIMAQPGYRPGKLKEVDTMCERDFSLGKFLSYYPKKRTGQMTGNASHMMSFVPGAPERLKEHYPNARLIAIMRNPIERAISHFNYDLESTRDPGRRTMELLGSLEAMVEKEIESLGPNTGNWDMKHIYDSTAWLNGYGMPMGRGLYVYPLKHYMELGFEIHCLSLEEYQHEFEKSLKGVLDWIGMKTDDMVFPKNRVMNRNTRKSTISRELRSSMKEFFQPHNEALFQLLGKRYDWD